MSRFSLRVPITFETVCGYDNRMTETNFTSSNRTEALKVLSEEDRVWLAERLVEYRELLEYLHSN